MQSKTPVFLPALGLLAALANPSQMAAQARSYTIIDLGPAGNPFSMANYVNNPGLVSGFDTVSDGKTASSHAVLWYQGLSLDIKQTADQKQPGLLGPNSSGGPVNDSGLVVIGGETATKDPNNENFCAYGTGLQCVVFTWKNGTLTQLPNPLGGINAGWGGMNNRGEIVGYAENSVRDAECLKDAPNGTGPQVLDYQAVIWGPGAGQFRQLNPLPGDSVGVALGINDAGQVVGISGRCGNTVYPGGSAGPHAVLWNEDGSVHDLGSFGGTSNPAILAVGNGAFAINNQGLIAGTSAMPGNQVNQPFVWSRQTGLQHLQLLPGDVVGAGLGMNNRGVIVGASISPGGLASGNPSAVLWPNGAEGGVTDLNSYLTSDSPFAVLLTAFWINDNGAIVGFGATPDGDVHGYLATPGRGQARNQRDSVEPEPQAVRRQVVLSEQTRRMLAGRWGMGR